jgi:hypothetical protein
MKQVTMTVEGVTWDAALIAHEDEMLRNPFLGGIKKVTPIITDDHRRHIKSHLKYLYNPFTWFHIVQHLWQLRAKKKLGIEGITNDIIMQQIQSQMKDKIMDNMIDQPDPKKPSYH